MRQSSIHQFVLKYSVAQPSLSRLNDVPVQFSIPGYVVVQYLGNVWMQNHRNHHRYPARKRWSLFETTPEDVVWDFCVPYITLVLVWCTV